MKRWVWLTLLCIAVIATLGLIESKVNAENVTVSIGVGDTDLVVRGQTSPYAFVTIKSDDNVIGTTTAQADGTYVKTFPAQTPGSQKVSVSAYTSAGRVSDTVNVHLSVVEHATTTVELFLPTTVFMEDASISQGQSLILRGETTPLSIVKLYLDNSEYVAVNSDTNGNWSLSVSASSLTRGEHEFFLRVVDSMGIQSYPTVARSFIYTPLASNEESASSSGNSSAGDVVLTPPLITFPTTGMSWERSEISVRGSAQKDVQIELWDGTRLLGSVWSDTNGDWQIRLFLESREYNLRARSCMEDRCSSFSQMTRFTYSPMQESLYVKIPRSTFTISVDESITINAEIVHGLRPYSLRVNWGDGFSSEESVDSENIIRSHTYSKAGKYTVMLDVEDKAGRIAGVQYTVNVKEGGSTILSNAIVTLVVLIVALLFPTVRHILWSSKIRKLSQ